ncbi:MAG: hypothetical protein ABIS51_16605 [Sphingomonas sp.]
MSRMIVAIAFWGLAIYVAASKFALSIAIPLAILLAAVGLKFVHAGMPIWVFLTFVGVVWFVAVLEIAFDGIGAMRRDQHDEASRKWTLSISLVGLALTFIVAIHSSQSSLKAIQRDLSSYGGSATASGKATD